MDGAGDGNRTRDPQPSSPVFVPFHQPKLVDGLLQQQIEIARATLRATSMQLVISYPALASSMHFGLALRPLKAACIFAGSNAENT